jgi:branched-chain amino acid transport system permease protein
MVFMRSDIGKRLLKQLIFVVALFAVSAVLVGTGIFNSYIASLLSLSCIYVIAALGLNLVTGMTGQLMLGQAGFMSIGAYCAAILMKQFGIPMVPALFAGGALAAAIGFLVGLPTLRLKGDYLAIVTLGFGQIIVVVFQNLTSITNGARGYMGIPTFPGLGVNRDLSTVIITGTVMVFAILAVVHLMTSSHGRALITIREDEIAAEAVGVKTYYTKMYAFVLSAFLAGVSGGLFAMWMSFIKPQIFDWMRSMDLLIIVVFGGMGSLTGTVVASFVLAFLQELLRVVENYRLVVYALLLILMMIFRPQGLLGTKELLMTQTLLSVKWWGSLPDRMAKWWGRFTAKLETLLARNGSHKKGGEAQ